MAAEFLARTGPVELIRYIYTDCGLGNPDILNLAASCCRLREVYLGDRTNIIWRCWELNLPGAHEALIAVRATALVKKAEARRELPPKNMDLASLSSTARRPRWSELHRVYALHRLGRAVQAAILHDIRSRATTPGEIYMHGKCPERIPEWGARVRKALYRLLIAGAALAGAYHEPLYACTEDPDLHVQNLRWADMPDQLRFPSQLEFYRKFAVTNTQATTEALDPSFASPADWLVKNTLADEDLRAAHAARFKDGTGRALCCNNVTGSKPCPLGPPLPSAAVTTKMSHSDTHLVVWQVMQMLWLLDRLDNLLLPPPRAPRPDQSASTSNLAWANPPDLDLGPPIYVFYSRSPTFDPSQMTNSTDPWHTSNNTHPWHPPNGADQRWFSFGTDPAGYMFGSDMIRYMYGETGTTRRLHHNPPIMAPTLDNPRSGTPYYTPATIVPFGNFVATEVSVSGLIDTRGRAPPPAFAKHRVTRGLRTPRYLVHWIFRYAGQPNREARGPQPALPPLELQFFSYILHRHAGGARFRRAAFGVTYTTLGSTSAFDRFADACKVFAHDDIPGGLFRDGSEMLVAGRGAAAAAAAAAVFREIPCDCRRCGADARERRVARTGE
ncbi:hypothetical protein B0T22DRAFT_512366 [Podospora appendiculata]|uniref:Uncharacterized protein n=1 Tax=Podospora appendiculata TaxID=314037 RepID=A0AAE0X9R1_9PEZI|nr:hypothetical protein B0T22DRAFT_512366 [Podospora appendiculata]